MALPPPLDRANFWVGVLSWALSFVTYITFSFIRFV